MKRTFIMTVLLIVVAAVIGCSKRSRDNVVRVDGSSTVFPITEAVAEEFQKANPGQHVLVGISGTGGGFKKFCRGETDIANASRPISAGEVDQCRSSGIDFVELPVAFDGLAVVVNPKNDWADSMTVAELKTIWEPEAQGKITRWSQVREGWPDRELHLFGAGVDSGTYDYFTAAVVGREHASRGDYTSSEDDNVIVQGVSSDPLALGFFGYAYYEENRNKLKLLGVNDGDSSNGAGAVLPSVQSVSEGAYQPLSRPIFIYVSTKSLNREGVISFTSYYLDHAPKLVREVGYIPLPDRVYALAKKRAQDRLSGSVFQGGSQVGVSIEKLLSAEQTN